MHHPPIISRKEATGTKYFTGLPCRRGHVAERFVSTGACAECGREDDRRRYAESVGYTPKTSRRNTPIEAPSGAVQLLRPKEDAAVLLLRQIASEVDLGGPVFEMFQTVTRHQLANYNHRCRTSLPPLPNARRTPPSLP